MKNEIIEGNELIAKFEGFIYKINVMMWLDDSTYTDVILYSNKEVIFSESIERDFNKCYQVDNFEYKIELSYHNNYNELMRIYFMLLNIDKKIVDNIGKKLITNPDIETSFNEIVKVIKEMNNKITYIDPPDGWKYGFPKILPEGLLLEYHTDWCIENGYPKDKKELLQYCRYFSK